MTWGAAAAFYLTDHAIDPSVAEKCGVRSENNQLIFKYKRPDGTTFDRPRSLKRKATW